MAFETTKKVNFQLGVSGDDKLRSAMASAGNAMRGLNREVGTVAQAFLGLTGIASAGAFVGAVTGIIEAKAKLYDLGLQTGISVEALGGLRRVADYSGTSLEDVAGASNKLSKALATNNEDSKGAAQAIKALGLNFDQFKALGADQQLLAVAKAMQGFGDGTGKSAAAMLLFGKTGATLLPFLKEFAERGIMATRETTASALAAKEFADNLVTLREASEDWKRAVVGDMLPTLTALTKHMAEAKTTSERLAVVFGYLRDNNHFSDLDLQGKAQERLNLSIQVTSGLYENMLRAQAAEPYNRAYGQRVAELRTELDMLLKASFDANDALKAGANLLTGAGAAGGARSFIDTLLSEFVRLRIVKPLLADLLSGGGGGGSSGGSALASIGSAVASFFGFRASGGPVNAGAPYIVGERGPEMFVPQTAGVIVPNGAVSGSSRVVVNSSNVFNIDSRSDRAQVGQVVAAAVAQGNRQLVEHLHAQGVM